MTEKSTKIFIGAFVLGAVALLIGFILLLGSGVLRGENPSFVLYFNTSLKGLSIGSPVYFKGIRIGEVKTIQILPDVKNVHFSTPVVIEIERDRVLSITQGGEDADFFTDTHAMDRLIQRGLRARLAITSILTGQLCIELDLLPNATPIDPNTLMSYHDSPEIPTQLSSLDVALSTLDKIPLQDILYDMVNSIRNISQQLQDLDIDDLVDSLHALSNDARASVNEFTKLEERAGQTLADYSSLAISTQKDLHATLDLVNSTLKKVSSLADTSTGTMVSLRRGADNAADILSEDSAPVVEFEQTMMALRKVAQDLSALAVLLESKPDSLIFGRNN